MAKVITYSRQFPGYHPKAGEPTLFPEKVLNHLCIDFREEKYSELLLKLNPDKPQELLFGFWEKLNNQCDATKVTTVRGNAERFRKGEFFSPRVWSGQPYNSQQIQFAPDTQVIGTHSCIINGGNMFISAKRLGSKELYAHAVSDGFQTSEDFQNWFFHSPDFIKASNTFDGQIIIF